jgi:two-component system, LytTR family, sensor kinase
MQIFNTIRKKVYDFLTIRVVYHTLFWMTILFALILVDRNEQNFWFSFQYSLLSIIFYVALVYFNLFYLIPNYLTEKRFLLYLGLFGSSVVLVTSLKIVLLYIFFTGYPDFQHNLLINQPWIFVSSFFIAGSSTVFKIITDWVRHQRTLQELETQQMQSELRFLKSQINPHFLFNTLNNLYALTLRKSDKAPDIVLQLSEMMRYMLYECNEKRVLLSKEVNYMQNYLDLERLRQGKNTDISFEVKGNIADQRVAPLMFIPFLENSFKHGLSHSISPGFVHIQLVAAQNWVEFTIENNKPDAIMRAPDGRKSGGIGLVNVRRRLDLLYPDHYALDIDDNPNFYKVRMKIELVD